MSDKSFLEYIESLSDDELGRVFRAGYQTVGISSPSMWNEIPDHRRRPHINAAQFIVKSLKLKWQLSKEAHE